MKAAHMSVRKTVSVREQNCHEGEMIEQKVFNFKVSLKAVCPKPVDLISHTDFNGKTKNSTKQRRTR